QAGHQFYTHSDTETLVHLYEEYGEGFAEHLNGMFCFALYDQRRNKIVIARDRLGEKQLYYSWQSGALIFGSEIKCVLESGRVSRDLDFSALDQYFRFLYIPQPATAFRHIRELPPATYMVLEAGRDPRLHSYWRLSFTPGRETGADLAAKVREQFARSVRSRLVSDVPLGVLLSGGIDSSAVAAMMVQAGGKVRTFTIGYDNGAEVYDERAHARAFAQHFGTEHHEFTIKPDIVELLPKLVRAFDQPFGDSSAVANYYVFQETRKHLKVVLTGLGGDEVFAGYERHMALRMHHRLTQTPAWLRERLLPAIVQHLPEPRSGGRWIDRAKRFVRAAGETNPAAYLGYVTWFDDASRRRLYSQDMTHAIAGSRGDEAFLHTFSAAGDGDVLSQALYTDTLTYLPGDLLVLTDRMSMANSVEARAPFIDHELVELVARMPAAAKMHRFDKKHLLKKAIAPLLPAEILKRPKKGFTIPLTLWLRDELQPYMRSVLDRQRVERTGLLEWPAVNQLIEEHVARKQNHQARLWALLVFMNWHEHYVEA
ncbi:MAG TPA: asparagine synthase (glutamine-hydrolyzing), partial [Paraburkholderia sp.]|uniref:asparagine synthase (glutamine-hydrolyzing) n=1 Tax=Paraburkholderia sp. TaxID=1926495 RepID=UPI002B46DED2